MHEKAIKNFIGTLIVKICGKDPLANANNSNKNEKKTSFYKKYLITSWLFQYKLNI